MASIHILGIRIDDVTLQAALAQVRVYLREGGFHQIATVNPEFIVLAQNDAEFRRTLDTCTLTVPDGVGVLWAARRLGAPLAERVAGQEMVDGIAALAAESGTRIFFLGAREGIAERAAAILCQKHPGLVNAGCYAGSPDREEDDEIVALVNAANAEILFVAYGPPRQEVWISRNSPRLNVKIAMGVGGTFDTIAGIVPRAPQWMRRLGFEWTYRLIRQPRRLKRQMRIPYFMWLVFTQGKQNSPAERASVR